METKTLDEVIEAIEVCRDSYVAGKIIKSDGLHYLKELRHILANTVWVGSTKEENGYWKLPTLPETGNDPLTWEDLKSMEGKPVWIELLNDDIWEDPSHGVDSEWWVIGEVRKDDIILATYLDEMELCEEDIGVIWQAYMKERK